MPRFKIEMTSRHNYFNSDMQPYSMIKVGLIVIGAFSVEIKRCGTKYDLVAPNPSGSLPNSEVSNRASYDSLVRIDATNCLIEGEGLSETASLLNRAYLEPLTRHLRIITYET